MRQHPSYQSRAQRQQPTPADLQAATEPEAIFTPAARHSGRACCCAALPAVIAVLPAGVTRPSATDLLLCGHHYRASRSALLALGATILSTCGHPVTAGAWPEPA